jgi:hypothetical protein
MPRNSVRVRKPDPLPVYDPVRDDAHALFDDIKNNLGDAPYFTREDLLHLPTFAHVATITRYNYVRRAVQHLLETGKLLEKSRTELIIGGSTRRYTDAYTKIDEFRDTVSTLVRGILGVRESFTVAHILDLWTDTDQHLTTNAKRVIVRQTLRAMRRDQQLREEPRHFYRR